MLDSSTHVVTAVQDAMHAVLQRDVEKHRRLVQRSAAPVGFLLRVNGTQLHSAVTAKDRKRPRSDVDDPALAQDAKSAPGTPAQWPCIALAALEAVLTGVENERVEAEGDGTASPTRSVLKAVTGVEVRHCELGAANVCNHHTSSGSADASAPTLAGVLLSQRRLWQPVHEAPCAASAFVGLTTLDVECNALGDAGLRLLCSGLVQHLRSLRRLHLASNGITAAGLVALADFARADDGGLPPQLETLGLTNNPLGTGAHTNITEEVWCDAFRAVASRVAATLRRLHLNHAALNSRELACVVGAVLTSTAEKQREPRAFDMLYVRENNLIDSAEALQLLRDAVGDVALVDNFVRRHVSM